MSNIDFSQSVSAEAEAQAQRRDDARAYLAETDWYVTRLTETGAPLPDWVAEARAEARQLLSA